jgi:CheY-like chemotaxis protein
VPPAVMDSAKRLILLVDDDDGDRHLVGEALGECGHAVELIAVRGGRELFTLIDRRDERLLQAVRLGRCLVLLDLNMPVMTGIDVLDRLKSDARFGAIPVVMFTTSDSPHDRKRCLEHGATGYLAKPMTFDQLVDRLRALVAATFTR